MSEVNSHDTSPTPARGYLTLTLHAHLPYVINHGTWPHGIEWLLEAAAETYLPLIRIICNLDRDGLALHCNLNLSPILLEQLAHPVFLSEFPRYLERKIAAAREDEAYFNSTGEAQYAETARFWQASFSQALQEFEDLGCDIISAFRDFHHRGLIEIITCCATHGYMPLLGTDESVRAQVRLAVQTHERHIAAKPRGIWAPECGYRPAGDWAYPVDDPEGRPLGAAFARIGVEQAIAESGIDYFFVDTHLIEQSAVTHSPYGSSWPAARSVPPPQSPMADAAGIYHPYFVEGSAPAESDLPPVTVFPRDPRTGLQVWSGDHGYPGDGEYLDFHKKRWPGGHRYWRVTGANVGIGDKQPYNAHLAADRVRTHAAHFVHLVWGALQTALEESSTPPVLCSPFDAELFGHWWFEGASWLEAVVRAVHASNIGLELITASEYLKRFPRGGSVSMPEGSWGAEGSHRVWLNSDTAWTYERLYPAELALRDICTDGRWNESPLALRIVQQLCRELLLLESSDWQFLITTGAARDYAEMRFNTHHDQFQELRSIFEALGRVGSLTEDQTSRLAAIEERDSIFPGIVPTLWSRQVSVTPASQIRTDRQPGPHTDDASASEVMKFITTPDAGHPSV